MSVLTALSVVGYLTFVGAETLWDDVTAKRLWIVGADELPPRPGQEPRELSEPEQRAILYALTNDAAATVADSQETAANLELLLRDGVQLKRSSPDDSSWRVDGVAAEWGLVLRLQGRSVPARLILHWTDSRWVVVGLALGPPTPTSSALQTV